MIKKILRIIKQCGGERGVNRFIYYQLSSLAFRFIYLSEGRFVKTDVRGEEFWFDSSDYSLVSLNLWMEGVYEKPTTSLVKKRIEEGDVVVDLGAHIGYYTKLFSELVGSAGAVFAFEADPNNFKLLKRNVNSSNAHLENKAVTDKDGFTNLFICQEYSGHHTAFPVKGWEPIRVKTTRLDSYFSEWDKQIDFIKLDIEGAEPLALEGMKSILREDKPEIVLEFTEFWELDLDIEDIIDYLQTLGYSFYKIGEMGTIHSISVEESIDMGKEERLQKFNSTSRNIFCK